jgi:ribosomal protein L5
LQTATAAAPAKGVSKDKAKNVMRDLKIRKLCLNICVGESGDRLTRAAKVRSVESEVKREIVIFCFLWLFSGVGTAYWPTARLL